MSKTIMGEQYVEDGIIVKGKKITIKLILDLLENKYLSKVDAAKELSKIIGQNVDRHLIINFLKHFNITISREAIDKMWAKSKERTKKTIEEKYGVDCVLKVPEVKEKIKRTLISHYGVDCIGKSAEIQQKVKNTLKEKYGVDNYMKTVECREKFKQTMQKKYGVSCAMQNPEPRKKAEQTCLNNWGVNNYWKSNTFKKELSGFK